MKRLTFLLVLLISFYTIASSEEKTDNKNIDIDSLYCDFAVPDISAFNLLGIEPKNISKPGNVKEFAIEMGNVLSKGQGITPGIAIEWSPVSTFDKKQSNCCIDLLRGLQITYGTMKDSIGAKAAYGIKWTLVDKTNPDRNEKLISKVRDLHNELFFQNPLSSPSYEGYLEQFNEFKVKYFKENSDFIYFSYNFDTFFLITDTNKLKEIDSSFLYNSIIDNLVQNKKYSTIVIQKVFIKDLKNIISELIYFKEAYLAYRSENYSKINNRLSNIKKEWKKQEWNQWGLAIGLGEVLVTDNDKWENIKGNKIVSFLNFGIPLKSDNEDFGVQLIGLIQYQNFFSKDSAQINNISNGGFRIIFGSNENRTSLDGMLTYIEKMNLPIERNLRITLGYETKISDDLWLEIAGGMNFNPSNKKSNSIASLMDFKYTFNKERRFGLK